MFCCKGFVDKNLHAQVMAFYLYLIYNYRYLSDMTAKSQ
jgi:hypothetical protein